MSYQRPCHYRAGESGFHKTFDQWMHLYERLAWRYGHTRAQQKMRGEDPDSRTDEAAWRRIGGRP